MKELPTTLTKENFFNAIQEMNPEGMKKFCDWIDEYKQKIGWSKLFRSIRVHTGIGYGYRLPKYHELPIEFQLGIFLRFLDESSHPLDKHWMSLVISVMRTHLMAL